MKQEKIGRNAVEIQLYFQGISIVFPSYFFFYMFKYKYFFLTILYASGIMWSSLQPDYPDPAGISNVWREEFMNFLHVPAYAGLAALLVLTFGGRRTSACRTGRDREWIMENGKQETKSECLGFKILTFPLSVFRIPYSVLRTQFSVILSFFLATAYGVLNEFVQAQVPGRFYSYEDMLRNAIGAGVGVWIVLKCRKQLRRL